MKSEKWKKKPYNVKGGRHVQKVATAVAEVVNSRCWCACVSSIEAAVGTAPRCVEACTDVATIRPAHYFEMS
jgi:hypothetical protein